MERSGDCRWIQRGTSLGKHDGVSSEQSILDLLIASDWKVVVNPIVVHLVTVSNESRRADTSRQIAWHCIVDESRRRECSDWVTGFVVLLNVHCPSIYRVTAK